MKTAVIIIMLCLLAVGVLGCAVMEPLKPQEVLKHPLGTDSIKVGMSKDEVRSLWGEPDTIVAAGRSKDVLGTAKEEWVYQARYSNLPLTKDYLGKSQRLYFDGDNLTGWKTEQ